MREIKISSDKLVLSLLSMPKSANVCILDSCNNKHIDSNLLIAGINPAEIIRFSGADTEKSLDDFSDKISQTGFAGIFTIAYEFGLRLEKIPLRQKEQKSFDEPDIFLALFECLVFHDYSTNKTFLDGNEKKFDEIIKLLLSSQTSLEHDFVKTSAAQSAIKSNFSKKKYLQIVEQIREYIRCGDTYQTNLTRQFRASLPENLTAQKIFWRLKKNHPAPFSAFIDRTEDCIVSVSPENFCTIKNRTISCSPIKGTRPRGTSKINDERLMRELLNSEKDLAENVMIVDLLRNDLGRICKFGSIEVTDLCRLETHSTYHHLVSTIRGTLKDEINFAQIIKSIFPCGSITGAPKIRTMRIIDQIETADRGLSMGAIGYFGFDKTLEMSVAIRTLTITNKQAVFNVGGGIVIDSDPESEYEETLVKAQALFSALGVDENLNQSFDK